ncbi:hypothetical protein [Tepidibacter hydrothermalis]|uniref:Uncharacterized protein n=1 Tax=Tepidibacter hydrothermalis TaxID=3036126 RepID=A0ABY8E7B8_9FIRM|nr:hypothetical protein [Tepidibacter hydrothermalis]WFD08778.1 hypothetical protein P4S50_10245 [Tepidibacter hydrothermalis]
MEFNISKDFARKLGIMLDTGLINYKHYYLWCDEIIEKLDNPPYWIIELATTKFLPSAVAIVNKYVFSEPFEEFNNSSGLYIACLFIKYETRQISWASFLFSAGNYKDGAGYWGKLDCEYFYYRLNEYEDSNYSVDIEKKQQVDIKNEFRSEIDEIYSHYNLFMPYFKKYVKN